MGFRAAFSLAFFGPLFWLALPVLHKVDPLWTEGRAVLLGLIGVFVAGIGAMVAFAAQMSMGSSWRVGVVGGETGDLVSGGLYPLQPQPDLCRAGGPAGGCCPGRAIRPDIRRGDPVPVVGRHTGPFGSRLRAASGPDYDRYAASVPRWIGINRKAEQ